MLCLTGNCGVQSSILALPTLSRTLWTPAQRVVQLPVDCGQCQKVWWHITSCQSLTTQTCGSLKNTFCSNGYISCPFDFPVSVALFDTFGAQYAVSAQWVLLSDLSQLQNGTTTTNGFHYRSWCTIKQIIWCSKWPNWITHCWVVGDAGPSVKLDSCRPLGHITQLFITFD